MIVFVSGAAGFIGFHLCKRLINDGISVVGFDNINPYYDTSLKEARLRQLKLEANKNHIDFYFYKENLEDYSAIFDVFEKHRPNIVVNLAAQAGVRYSIDNPGAYIQSNLVGFGNILECCRHLKVEHLIYASSSSVYGGNKNMPFSERQGVDHPVSLYAATKKSNELMAHTYSHLFNLATTGLRFFTVYGPWGRPDMALFVFTKAILAGEPIKVFNNGLMVRDFTYIDDIVESLKRLIVKPPTKNETFDMKAPDPSTSWCKYRIFNIGNSKPVPLMDYIQEIEIALGIKAKKEFLPMQQGDVQATEADTSKLEDWVQFKPKTSIRIGVIKFIEWYKDFYDV